MQIKQNQDVIIQQHYSDDVRVSWNNFFYFPSFYWKKAEELD